MRISTGVSLCDCVLFLGIWARKCMALKIISHSLCYSKLYLALHLAEKFMLSACTVISRLLPSSAALYCLQQTNKQMKKKPHQFLSLIFNKNDTAMCHNSQRIRSISKSSFYTVLSSPEACNVFLKHVKY